ncbi:helix-turn-helix domain-containing protein [Acerihabitans arboris]|uniref:Helix-turn-helix domain-containing protein n=1 Tax=Acerihabitans arboris TaxID=2691583 RepID=A0A845SK51_9GAMM|nr:helix-turn-helix transcriptional regulator [Acerihabitans arboris]NDL64329.1 helix-turn-helix domain-containing protein [Acerihabitans arboris]
MLHRALRLVRQYHNESIVGLSIALNIPKETIAQLESGESSPSVDVLQRYSSHFDIPVPSFVFFSETLGTQGRLSKRLRLNLAGKVLDVLEWASKKNEKTEKA